MYFFNRKLITSVSVMAMLFLLPFSVLAADDHTLWLKSYNRGDVEGAIAQLENDLRQAIEHDDHTLMGNVYNNLASMYEQQKKTDFAEETYKKGILEHEMAGTDDAFLYGTSYFSLGEFYRKEKRYDEAIAHLNRALSIMDDTNIGHFMPLQSLGMIYRDQGKYDLAEPLLIRGIMAAEKNSKSTGEQYSSSVLEGLYSLAILYGHKKDYQKAKTTLEQAIPLSIVIRGEQSSYTLGLQKSLRDVNQVIKNEQSSVTFKSHLDKGIEARDSNDATLAVSYFKKAVDIAHSANGGKGDEIALELAYSSLATGYVSQENWAKAKEALSKAIQYNEAHFGKNHKRAQTYQTGLAKINSILTGRR